jgi:hypothetical protein
MSLLLDGAYNLGDDSWLDEEEEEEDTCEPTLGEWENTAAADLTELLARSTTVDAPWAEVLNFQAAGCDDWENPPESLTQAWWNEAFVWSWSELPDNYREIGEWTPGGAAFASMLATAMVVIDENIDDADWDPADAQDLYDSRDALIDSLLLGVSEYPHGYLEQTLYVDLSECSQEAVALIDIENGQLLIIHEESHC